MNDVCVCVCVCVCGRVDFLCFRPVLLLSWSLHKPSSVWTVGSVPVRVRQSVCLLVPQMIVVLLLNKGFVLFFCRRDLWELESSTRHLTHLAATHQRGKWLLFDGLCRWHLKKQTDVRKPEGRQFYWLSYSKLHSVWNHSLKSDPTGGRGKV